MITPSDQVYLFWDNSNIFVPARYVANGRFKESSVDRGVRIQFDRLYDLARAGRQVEAAYCVGSVPPELDRVWERLRAVGVDVELFERGAHSHTEQAVDQALQVQMLRALNDVSPPCVAVLLTGDGAGYEQGFGFYADLERMYHRGWGVEVISWEATCSHAMKQWAQEVGVFIPLDNFYRQVTFVEGGRKSEVLSLKGRRRAQPHNL
ncbi:NYN domain-containing protein [Microbispora bryophytorum]|uniref:NYN domain-containing protein n=1 Tax=Microbispora bryophytorum subsp. camponoti TaxID=1677852 RepID=A0ABR8LG00_9ACTN|nr:NYN domain-containing protein [Microbispora camponoti]MBD3148440.1 NYN domain-containing protein [Microbispora camponoti]